MQGGKSHRVAVWQIQALRLKICDSHLTCKAANKCLNVLEQVGVVEWNKMVPSLPLLSCELSVSVKENPDRKKKCLGNKILPDMYSHIFTPLKKLLKRYKQQ